MRLSNLTKPIVESLKLTEAQPLRERGEQVLHLEIGEHNRAPISAVPSFAAKPKSANIKQLQETQSSLAPGTDAMRFETTR
jgi:hypothetical protein